MVRCKMHALRTLRSTPRQNLHLANRVAVRETNSDASSDKRGAHDFDPDVPEHGALETEKSEEKGERRILSLRSES